MTAQTDSWADAGPDYDEDPWTTYRIEVLEVFKGDAPREIKVRHIGNCLKADPAYGKGVADALGIPLSEAGA